MSYFTEFEQAFISFLKSTVTNENNGLQGLRDEEKAAILKASSFAELCAIPEDILSTGNFIFLLTLAKQLIQYQSQSNEAFIVFLLKIEQDLRAKSRVLGIRDDLLLEGHIRGIILKFLDGVAHGSDETESLKRIINARLFLRKHSEHTQYSFKQAVDESKKKNTFGWDLYEKLVKLLGAYIDALNQMPLDKTEEDNAQYLASIQHYITDADDVTKELYTLAQTNKLDSNLVFAIGLELSILPRTIEVYKLMVRKAADMGNEFAKMELIRILPQDKLAEAMPLLKKLIQLQNKFIAANAIDFMQAHHDVFGAAIPAAAERSAPFCLDSLRAVTASTREPSAPSAATGSNSRTLPSNFVPTNLSLARR